MEKNNRLTRKMPPPKVLVEVVSPGKEGSENYVRDYQDKPAQYAAIGVPEVWQIDPAREWIKVGTLTNGAYQFRTFTGQDTIASSMFPVLNLTAGQILRAGR